MTAPAPPVAPRLTWRTIARLLLGVGFATVLLGWALPRFARTSWGEILDVLRGVHPLVLVGLTVLSLTALSSYAVALAASLPGLRAPRALILNVCGSSVSKTMPGGGAVGLAATFAIGRSWGFSTAAVSTSAVVTLVWNTLARVSLPVAAIVALTLTGTSQPGRVRDAAIAGAVTGTLIIIAFVAALANESVAQAVGRAVDRVSGPLLRRRGRTPRLASGMTSLRGTIVDVVRRRWVALTLGTFGFLGLQYALFVVCLEVTGAKLGWVVMFGAFAIGRLLSTVGVTPGGLGVTETGTAAALVLWGAPTAEAAAAVVLFSIFTNLIEIPFGAVGWLLWWLGPRRPIRTG